MNRKILATAIGIVAVGAMASSAVAQTSNPIGLSVRAGIVFPTSSFGRDIGKQWLGVGAEFKLKDMNYGTMNRATNSHLSISADYYGKGDGSAVPVLVNFVGTQNEFFYSVGAGVAFTRDTDLEGVPAVTTNRNRTNFAYQFGLGYNFQQGSNPLFLEAKFWGNSNSNLNAFGVYVGVRL